MHHLHADGSITTQYVKAEDGYVTFEVSDLSTFAVEYVEGDQVPSEEPPAQDESASGSSEEDGSVLPQTGDASLVAAGAAMLGAGALLGTGFLVRRRGGQ